MQLIGLVGSGQAVQSEQPGVGGLEPAAAEIEGNQVGLEVGVQPHAPGRARPANPAFRPGIPEDRKPERPP